MTEYTPVRHGTVTKYVVVESVNFTPADLGIRAYEISKDAMVKETCFGLVVNGKEEDVNRVVAELRKIDPDHIFVKDRGFPPGDPRRCRANLGGARPGYHGLENEMAILPYVSHGLGAIKTRDITTIPLPPDPLEHKEFDAARIKKLIETQES